MTVPKYKLIFFDTHSIGEQIRWCFAYGGIPYEDVRVDIRDWKAIKPTTPFGKVPYLEVDGKVLSQSLAIARFIAHQVGLVPVDEFETAQADAMADYVADGARIVPHWFFCKDEAKRTELRDAFINEDVQPFLQGFQRVLLTNGGGNGFLIGKDPTWADLAVVCFLDRVLAIDGTVLDKNYQPLNGLIDRVHNLKGIKEWLAKRPVVDFYKGVAELAEVLDRKDFDKFLK